MKGQVWTDYLIVALVVVALVISAMVMWDTYNGINVPETKHMLALENGSIIQCNDTAYGTITTMATKNGTCLGCGYFTLYECNNVTYQPGSWNYSYNVPR